MRPVLVLSLLCCVCVCARVCRKSEYTCVRACSHGECGCTLEDWTLSPPTQECLAYRYVLSQLGFRCWCWWCFVFVFVLGTKPRASCILDKHRTVKDKDQTLRQEPVGEHFTFTPQPGALWPAVGSNSLAQSAQLISKDAVLGNVITEQQLCFNVSHRNQRHQWCSLCN